MTKQIKRLLILLIMFTAAAIGLTPPARAEGGLVLRPYWIFPTETPVTHVQAGDIDGDGVKEVVIVTADGLVHAVENNGDLIWRYESGDTVGALLVTDLDGDEQIAEIHVAGKNHEVLLSDTGEPVWRTRYSEIMVPRSSTAVDLNGDGYSEILLACMGVGIRTSQGYVYDQVRTSRDWYFRRPSLGSWVGQVDADEQIEVVPNPAGGHTVYVFENNMDLVWQKDIEDEVGLVQGGDMDGDGLAEVVVLSTSWDLLLMDGDGSQVWRNETISVENAPYAPIAGQLLVRDLNSDDQVEIVVLSPAPAAAVHVFDGMGRQLWQTPLEAISTPARLIADDLDDDGKSELVVTTIGQNQVYLIDASGHHLAEYHPSTLATCAGPLTAKTTGAVAYADLNNDGLGEIIVGTRAGVQVFGTSPRVERRKLWQSPVLDDVVALELADLDGDGLHEVVAGSRRGQVSGLADDGHLLWQVDFDGWVRALSIGDINGDGTNEVVVGTADNGGQIHVLEGDQVIWTISEVGSITDITTHDVDSDDRAEIIVGSNVSGKGTVLLMDSNRNLLWQREFDELVTAIGNDKGHILVGTATGRVYRLLMAFGAVAREYDIGAQVLSVGEGLAATTDGLVYQLEGDEATLVRDLEMNPFEVQVGVEAIVATDGDHEVGLALNDEKIWKAMMDQKVSSIAAGDITGDEEVEIAVATESGEAELQNSGRVLLFGTALDQPPLLTQPDLTETRTGYEYSVDIIDPEEDALPITLEIWDPSTGTWQSQAAQSLAEGQAQGKLTWDVSEPFDIWDSGQESRFRFVYDIGGQQIITGEIPGPLNIPTTPWYVYYGQRVGLGALILLVPALGLLLYRRQQAHHRSPAGQAEALLKQLKAQPDEILTRLHTLTNENPTLLTYLSGAARQAGETAIADLSEGHNLLLVRSEVTAEDLRVVVDAIGRLDGPSDEKKTKLTDIFDLFQQALEANTVNRIVALSVRLHELLTRPDAQVGEALNDLNEVIKTLNNFQRVAAFEDKTAYLGQALEALGRFEREFRTGNMWQPEGNILARIAANWLLAVNNALQDLQGRAQIEATLKTRHLLSLDQASLSLELTNTGRSPASNVTISLVPDETFAVGNGTVHLDMLVAGRSAVVELPISAATSVEQFRAEFNITFDDRERSGKSLAFADRVQLLRPTTEFQSMPNPYAPGTPLAPGSPIFFGRDDLFEFVGQNLAGLTRQNILVLIGQRRMGKTSFLQQLPARLGEAYLPVYIDGQSLGIDPGMANFFHDLALAIVDALDDQGIEIEEPEPEDFEERPSGAFERSFLPRVFEAIGERQLLLMFDEFEELEMRVTSGKLEATIFSFLRHLMQHNRKLGFIFVGTHRLEALSTDYWSIFFNIALYKHVVFLSETAARALIIEPVAEYGLVYDDLALDKMLRVTAGHPYFLQLTCHALVNRANRERRGYLTIQDVNSVLDEMVELGEAHFAFLWEQSSPAEQLILSALTRLLGQEPTITATQVVELLAERGITRDIQDVTEMLWQLVERDVIREIAGQPPRYEFKVELVRLWIERYKALGRVMEENLTTNFGI